MAGPHPGCFCERVRNRLKTKRLSFSVWQKTAQEYENKGLERKTLSARSRSFATLRTTPIGMGRTGELGVIRRGGDWRGEHGEW